MGSNCITEIVWFGIRFGVLQDDMLKRAMPIFGIVRTAKISTRTTYVPMGLGIPNEVYMAYSLRFYGIFPAGQFPEKAMLIRHVWPCMANGSDLQCTFGHEYKFSLLQGRYIDYLLLHATDTVATIWNMCRYCNLKSQHFTSGQRGGEALNERRSRDRKALREVNRGNGKARKVRITAVKKAENDTRWRRSRCCSDSFWVVHHLQGWRERFCMIWRKKQVGSQILLPIRWPGSARNWGNTGGHSQTRAGSAFTCPYN